MSKYDVAIIGAGLGGLECGLILAKHGKKVCVLEKNPRIGGCIQIFQRKGYSFDTGFHYVGSLDEGQMLNKLFSYLGLMDMPWIELDKDCFDEIVIGEDRYKFASGYDNFQRQLTEYFPHQKENLQVYVDMLRKVSANIVRSFEPRSTDDFYERSLFATSAYQFLCETISDERLRDVLSGTSLKMELNAEKLPLYTFAQINSSFVESAYRIRGGGMQIAEKLKEQIENLGGTVRINAEVTGVVESQKIECLVINNDTNDVVKADWFISNAHPAATMGILSESKLLRNVYRKRITGLENTFGTFTVNIALKPGKIRYINRNIFAYRHGGIWNFHSNFVTKDVEGILICSQPPVDGTEYTENVDILTPMRWSDVEKWLGTKILRRGKEYEDLKAEMADKCIDFANQYVPGLREAIEAVYTSTPLTYSDYTATGEGSSYGIRKDYNKLMFTVLTPRTPIENLLLTGQSLNLHGILGVSMTSIFTCAEILGMETVVNSLNEK